MSASVSQVKSNKMAKKTDAPVVAVAEPVVKGAKAKKAAPAQAEVVVPVVAAVPVEVRTADAILTAALESVRTQAKAAAESYRALAHELRSP